MACSLGSGTNSLASSRDFCFRICKTLSSVRRRAQELSTRRHLRHVGINLRAWLITMGLGANDVSAGKRLHWNGCTRHPPPPPPMARQRLVGKGLLIIEASRSHSDTPHSAGLLWTSDQLVTETSTWQHTKLTRDSHPCPRRDSNPQSQQASGRRPTP